jgi:hypothetical protein
MTIFAFRPANGRRVVLLARSGLLGLAVASSSLALGPLNVLEGGFNKFRTGADTAETVLTPANVRSSANLFHRQFVMKVDGKIEGSPLYASAVAIAGGIYDILYVACTTPSMPLMPIPARSFPRDRLALPSPDSI